MGSVGLSIGSVVIAPEPAATWNPGSAIGFGPMLASSTYWSPAPAGPESRNSLMISVPAVAATSTLFGVEAATPCPASPP